MRGDIQTDEALQDLGLAIDTVLIVEGWESHEHNLYTKGLKAVRCYIKTMWPAGYRIHVEAPVLGGARREFSVMSSSDFDGDELLAKIADVI